MGETFRVFEVQLTSPIQPESWSILPAGSGWRSNTILLLQVPPLLHIRGCVGKGGQCREGHWMDPAGSRGLSRELMQVRVLKGVPLLCSYQEWFFGVDCHYSGTMEGLQQNWEAAEVGSCWWWGRPGILCASACPGTRGAETWGHSRLCPAEAVGYRRGGDACAGEVEGWSQKILGELLGVLEQRHFAAAAMVEVIVLTHTQLPKPHKEKACKDTPPETCSHNFLGPSQQQMSAGQILLSPNSLAISHSFPCPFYQSKTIPSKGC